MEKLEKLKCEHRHRKYWTYLDCRHPNIFSNYCPYLRKIDGQLGILIASIQNKCLISNCPKSFSQIIVKSLSKVNVSLIIGGQPAILIASIQNNCLPNLSPLIWRTHSSREIPAGNWSFACLYIGILPWFGLIKVQRMYTQMSKKYYRTLNHKKNIEQRQS